MSCEKKTVTLDKLNSTLFISEENCKEKRLQAKNLLKQSRKMDLENWMTS